MLFLASVAFAAPLNLYGGLSDAGSVALAPTAFADAAGVAPSLVTGVGLGGHADLTIGVGGSADWAGTPTGGGLDAVARYGLGDELVLAAHGGVDLTTGSVVIGPELHWSRSFGIVDVTANVGWRADASTGESTAALGVAPEVWLGDRVSFFVEVDPSLALTDSDVTASLLVVPGLSANLSEDGAHALCAGVQLPTDSLGDVSVGVWYSVAFDARAKPTGRQPD